MSIDDICLNYYGSIRSTTMKNRIRDLREDHDLSQQRLAEQIGITQRKYSYIETGTQPLTDEILIKLANFYHVSIDYILCQTDNPKRS